MVVRRGMRAQGSDWRGPDADEMDDVGRGNHAKGMLTARGCGAGSEFRHQLAGGDRQEFSLTRLGQTVG